MADTNNHAALIWAIAELLRGDYKQSEYGKVILPLVVMRRLDCVLEPTKGKVLVRAEKLEAQGIKKPDPVLRAVAGQQFYNTSPLTLAKLLDDAPRIATNLRAYIAGFSETARDVIERFSFTTQIGRLDKAGLLYQVIAKFVDVDLHPGKVSNVEMGYLYEELLRRFSELSNETAGEHFTPREVIRLMVNLLYTGDDKGLTDPGAVRTVYDPACGTGGMLSVSEDHIRSLNPKASVHVFGQELNDETYATAQADMLMRADDSAQIRRGNTLTDDQFKDQTFHYMLANPPFGVDWKKYAKPIEDESKSDGHRGRFGAGLPRKSDGSLLFLQHMLSKMRPVEEGGSRIGIVFNASPLFTGAPGGGESEIRRWIIENDWLEAIVALPEQLFYNTGIATYFWILTNNKAKERRGKIQLVDARSFWEPMRKSLGEKRRFIGDDQIDEITRLYGEFTESDLVKILPNEYFGFMRITVERPMRRRWVIDEDTVEAVKAHTTFDKLGKPGKKENPDLALKRRQALLDTLEELADPAVTFTDFDDLWKRFRAALEARGGEPSAAVRRMLFEAAGRHDPDADPVTDGKDRLLPDPDLRDTETVPIPDIPAGYEPDPSDRLKSEEYRKAVAAYMTAEVVPWVDDAWADHSKTKIGYEIPLTREFYRYTPPRPLEEIDADIKKLTVEVDNALGRMSLE